MKNNKDKPYIVTPEHLAKFGEETSILTQPTYKIDVNKIKTIKDIKLILKHLNLSFKPNSKDDFEEFKHLLIID
jgi:hypothetical protein